MPRFPTSCLLLPTSRPRFIFYFPARFDELPSAEKRGKWSSLWFGNCRCLVSIVFLDDFDDADGDDDDYVVDMDDVVPAFFSGNPHLRDFVNRKCNCCYWYFYRLWEWQWFKVRLMGIYRLTARKEIVWNLKIL